MATTSPDLLRTPDAGDPFAYIADMQILAQDVQAALVNRANANRGTIAQRTAFTASALPGMLWQDTDGIGMIWKRGASQWEPAVWRWSGTTAQMNAFTQAPNGFEWFDTSTGVAFIRIGGTWRSAPGGSIVANLVSGSIAGGSTWTVFTDAGQWSISNKMGATTPWSSGLRVPYDGVYRVGGTATIAWSATANLALKRNDTSANGGGAVAGTVITGNGGVSYMSFSRELSLVAGDTITLGVYSAASGGPFALTPAGTSISLTLLSH